MIEIEELRRAQRGAKILQDRASRLVRDLVRDLLAAGWKQVDIAYVLNVSPQRVSQLAHSASHSRGSAAH